MAGALLLIWINAAHMGIYLIIVNTMPIAQAGRFFAQIPEPGMMLLFGLSAGFVGLMMGRPAKK